MCGSELPEDTILSGLLSCHGFATLEDQLPKVALVSGALPSFTSPAVRGRLQGFSCPFAILTSKKRVGMRAV